MKRGFAAALLLVMLFTLTTAGAEDAVRVIDCRNDESLSEFTEGETLLQVRFPTIYGCNGAVVRCGETVIVIDSCTCTNSGEQYDQLKALIDDMGITHIDYCINTHPDNDHVNGFFRLLKQYEVDCMITGFPDKDYREERQEKLYNLCQERGIEWVRMGNGDSLDAGDIHLDFVQRFNSQDAGINNSSLICRVSYKGRTMLFPGDIQKVTQDILGSADSTDDISADVINWPHHGYNKMQWIFMERVGASIYVITSGPNDAKTAAEQLKENGFKNFYYTSFKRLTLKTNGDHWEVFNGKLP